MTWVHNHRKAEKGEVLARGSAFDVGLIDTEGGTATDVFYITRQGAKLSSDQQRELHQGLQRRLQAARG